MKSIIKRVLSDDWTSLQQDIERDVADRIKAKISDKKIEVLSRLNNISIDRIKEVMSVSK